MSEHENIEERASKAIQPWGARVAVTEPPGAEERRPSGLIVPQGHTRLARGIVTAIGDEASMLKRIMGSTDDALEPGDVVWYLPNAGYELGDVRILDSDQIIAVERHEGQSQRLPE